jgi:hypothetical protein
MEANHSSPSHSSSYDQSITMLTAFCLKEKGKLTGENIQLTINALASGKRASSGVRASPTAALNFGAVYVATSAL